MGFHVADNNAQEAIMSELPDHQLPATFNRLAWSNLAAQSAEQIALAAAPIVAVLLLGVGEGQTGLLQTALTLPFVLFAIPAGLLADRFSRRWLMTGSEALRAAAPARNPAADMARPADAAPCSRCSALSRSVERWPIASPHPHLVPSLVSPKLLPLANARIELARTVAFAGGPALGRRAGGMGRCCAGVWICRRTLGHRGRAAVRNP